MNKLLSYKSLLILNSFAIFLTIFAIVLRGIIYFTPKQPEIKPANPVIEKAKNTEDTASSSTSEKVEATNQTSILSAKKGSLDEYEGEITQTFTVEDTFSTNDLEIKITNVALAILSEESMKEMGLTGQGLLDVTFEVTNKGTKDVQIYPSLIKFKMNGVEYPVDQFSKLKDTNIKPEKSVTGNVIAPIQTLANTEDIKDFTFTWKTTKDEVARYCEVIVMLN